MKKWLFLLISIIIMPLVSHGEEQPPYEISEPKINENFRETYLALDKLSLLNSLFTYTLTSSSNSLCIDNPTFCVDANNNQAIFTGGSETFPSIAFSSNTGLYNYTAAGNNNVAISADGVLNYRTGAGGQSWYINGNEEVSLTATALFPAADNANTVGRSGNRWSEVWAANGTIQTSSSRRKRQIREIRTNRSGVSLQSLTGQDVTVSSYTVTGSSLTIPRGIVYKWRGREGRADDKDIIGFVGDDLPEEAHAILPNGDRDEENFYLSSVIGILSAKIRELELRIEVLETP